MTQLSQEQSPRLHPKLTKLLGVLLSAGTLLYVFSEDARLSLGAGSVSFAIAPFLFAFALFFAKHLSKPSPLYFPGHAHNVTILFFFTVFFFVLSTLFNINYGGLQSLFRYLAHITIFYSIYFLLLQHTAVGAYTRYALLLCTTFLTVVILYYQHHLGLQTYELRDSLPLSKSYIGFWTFFISLFVFSVFVTGKKTNKRLAAIAALVLLSLFTKEVGLRATQAALAAFTLAFFLFLIFGKLYRRHRALLFIAPTLLALPLFLFLSSFLMNEYRHHLSLALNPSQEVESLPAAERSIVYRASIYVDAFRYTSEQPFLGGGANSWALFDFSYYPGQEKHPESALLVLLMDFGIIGAFLFYSFIAAATYSLYRSLSTARELDYKITAFFVAAYFGWFTFSLFQPSLLAIMPLLMLPLLSVSILCVPRKT